MQNNEIYLQILRIGMIFYTAFWSAKVMLKINSNHTNEFGLGATLLHLIFISIFSSQWWITYVVSALACICLYFFTLILKTKYMP